MNQGRSGLHRGGRRVAKQGRRCATQGSEVVDERRWSKTL